MKRIIIASLGLIMLVSCMYKKGSGNIITETKHVGPFKKLDVSGGFEVEIKNGPAENVVVEADDNLMKYVEVKVDDDELTVSLRHISVSDAHLRVFITAPDINMVSASAGATIKVKDALRSAGSVTLKASSGANIKTALDAPDVKAEVSSGGELTLSGKTKDLHASSSSGSSVAASDLLTENSYVNASSGGSAHVNASVNVDASASSGGIITYRGAASVKKSESSGGEITKEN